MSKFERKSFEVFLKNAKAFYQALKKVKSVERLLTSSRHRNDFVSACGFSDKARSQLTEAELITYECTGDLYE